MKKAKPPKFLTVNITGNLKGLSLFKRLKIFLGQPMVVSQNFNIKELKERIKQIEGG